MAKLYLGSSLISGGGSGVELTVTPSVSSVDEGSSVTFTIATIPAQASATVDWRLAGVSSADVTGGALSGTATTNGSGVATVVISLVADNSTGEGAESMTMQAALYSESSAVTVNDTSILATDPNFSSVLLLLPMDGTNGSTTFTDVSNAANAITRFGSANISTTQSKHGGAAGFFEGASSYICNSSALTSLGTEDYTIECWVYSTESGTANDGVFQLGTSTTPAGNGSQPHVGMATGRQWFWRGTTAGSWVPDTWYHVALCRSGTTCRLFVDGLQIGGNFTESNNYSTLTHLQVGVYYTTTYFKGYIDDVRYTRGVARYTSNFTPPTSAHLTA
jgi:hypothetical protein